ncbi:hypothetical protein [Nonomuraea typhae]|uniref:Tetratricopeptide repeat protein n=1 Tax=Nonomuraea typhae TaxID=2603600 RepID=A0ABW7Z825_9ACTN
MGNGETGGEPDRSPREWCALSAARLRDGRPEAALDAALRAAGLDPAAEWAHRLVSLAEERLGRDEESLVHAREAVRLSPGSWAARLRLSAALRRLPGGWEHAVREAELARAYGPDELTPHLQLGDLALVRGDHRGARTCYAAALERDIAHPQTRVNLGLAWLRWDHPRAHHDPAWPVDPRETGRARRALEVWSRQTRLLLALATAAVVVAAFVYDLGAEARAGGVAVLVVVIVLGVRQARRVRLWSHVPAMFGRDPWLGASTGSALVAVAAYAAWLVLPVVTTSLAPVWAGLTGILLLGWPALALLHALGGIWRGRPLRALEEFSLARGEREGRRDAGIALWIVLGRVWSVMVPLACAAAAVEPRAAVLALAVPYPLVEARRKARAGADRWLSAAVLLVVTAAPACAVGGVFGLVWAWWAGLGALGAVVPVFAVCGARSWWRGAPGPWRASLIMCEPLLGDAPPVALSAEVRQAFAYARSVVLSYTDPAGPRVVGAVASVTLAGDLRLIAEPQAWAAVEADPRVAVFAADPLQRRFWVEVRGIALAHADVLRVTPTKVLVGEFPGRHQRR